MTPSSEVLVRLRNLIRRDLDQRIQRFFVTLKHSALVHDLTLQSSEVKGASRGDVPPSALPLYMQKDGVYSLQSVNPCKPFSCYVPDEDVTLWVNYPVRVGDDVWSMSMVVNQRIVPSPAFFLEIWKRWDSTDHHPFPVNVLGEYEFVFDKRREVEWLNQQGLSLSTMVHRNPKEAMSVDRKYEESFIHTVYLTEGRRFSLKTMEDFYALLKAVDELEGVIVSKRKVSQPMATDDTEFIDRLRDTAYLIKAQHGKEAGDLAFEMQGHVRSYLLNRKRV